MTPAQQNGLLGIALLVGGIILAFFLATLADAKPGEIAGALGSVVGGIFGALGAAFAVYLTLKGQREDETERFAPRSSRKSLSCPAFPASS
jgi:hypothetical protein